MDQIKEFLIKRSIITLLVIVVLAVGLLVSIRLVQQQTQLKSKAATSCVDQRDPNCSGDDLYCWCRGCTILQSGCTFIHYEPGGWQCKAGTICSGNAVEYVPSGANCSTVTQCAVPPPPPSGPQPVTVSGKVVNKATNQGVQITINQGAPGECNIGTRQTNSSGVYSFDKVKPTDNTFCLRTGLVAGYKSVETTGGQGSYENLAANSSSNGGNYDFYLMPDDNARPSVFKIFNENNKDVTAGPILISNSYAIEVRMVNNGNSIWKKGIYKLQPTGNTESTWSLNDSYDWISPSEDVASGQEAVFSVSATAPANPVGPPGTSFDMSMTNSQQNFGAGIQRLLQVQEAVGGPGPSPSPGTLCGECGTPISGVSCDVSWNDNTSICRAKGSTHRNDKCIEKICWPPKPLGQCGTCWGPIDSQSCTFDSNKCPPVEDPSKTICVVSGSRRGDCVAQGTPSPSPSTGFDFSITKPSDFIMTKGQSQVGKEFVVNKTAGSAEDVTFAINGNTGGAVAVFSPSGVCKPDPSICRRTVTFNTTSAEPGDYSITIQGTSTGGRVRESDPFNLKINPLAVTVTCFVISENRNTRDLFRNCANLNVQSGVAGLLTDTSLLVDFQLSAQNGNKTLYARFLKLPAGESIITCTADKCKDTQAGITLNAVAPSPSPSPSPSLPPVTGCACQADNGCSSSCKFTKLTGVDYGLPPGTGPIQCSLPAAVHNIIPSSQDKNSWCNRQLRTTGDADGNAVKDENDYLYWLTAVNLGKVPLSVNPDFDGDGQIDADDLDIWRR